MEGSRLTYFLLLALSILYPFLKSNESKLKLWSFRKYLIPAIIITAVPFLIWDVYFAREGIWSFNRKYVTGWFILGLPVEEWLFFLFIPYACHFIYHVLNYFFPRIRTIYSFSVIHWIIVIGMINYGFKYFDRTYTAVAFLSAAVVLVGAGLLPRIQVLLPRFYLTYFVSLIPFLIVNGVLTFLPVVSYDDTRNLGIRLWTIPVEDTVYLVTLLFLNLTLFEGLRSLGKVNSRP